MAERGEILGVGKPAANAATELSETVETHTRRGALAANLWRAVRADPKNLPEQIVLYVTRQQASPVREWAEQHSTSDREDLLHRMRHEMVGFSRINGALSGTPFFIALVPAYVSVLREQARAALRIAALNGRDPAGPERPAELLVFLGVYRSVEAAQDGLAPLRLPEAHKEKRGLRQVGGPRAWIELVTQVLVLAGFIEPSSGGKSKPSRSRRVLRRVLALGVWALTWIIPITFMLLMAWTCEGRTRKVFDRALSYYGDEEVDEQAWRSSMSRWRRERPLRTLLVAISVLIPLGLAGYVSETGSSGWLKVVAGLAALVTALLLAGIVSRR